MTREEAKREMLFAKREVMADSWIDKAYDMAIKTLEQPEQLEHCPIYDGVCGYPSDQCYDCPRHHGAQPEQRYTKEELRVFAHGISLSLLSKRSAQHWQYDEDTATEIKFLERLYEKVGADMRGEQDG